MRVTRDCVRDPSPRTLPVVDTRDAELAVLVEQVLEELRALREATARQTALLEAILAKLGDIERTQFS